MDKIIEIDENGKVHHPPSDAAREAEDTETICCEIMKVLGLTDGPSFDLLNCVAAYAMRCEDDGRSFQCLVEKCKSLEVKNGFIPDRRAPIDAHPHSPRPDKECTTGDERRVEDTTMSPGG